MKILFGIQGTGNGHISRAREIIPYLKQHGEVDLLISGTQSDVDLPYEIKYRLHGMSFTFGKKGGIDFWDTYKRMRTLRLFRDIRELPVEQYDLVINDFEPISAWACKLKKKPCFALSHQAAFLSPKTPRPQRRNHFAEAVFRHYAPAQPGIGFHFEPYDDFIHTPVIRSEIRQLEPSNNDHITVYLPAYSEEYLIKYFKNVKGMRFEIFSKHTSKHYTVGNTTVSPINNEAYNKSLASSTGLITGGGFEAPTEAIFLGKKVMVVPMIGQYEQHCNALGAKKAGCTVITEINGNFQNQLNSWLEYAKPVKINYPDNTADIVQELITSAFNNSAIPVNQSAGAW